MTNEQTEIHTAYHEAAHYVVRYRLRPDVWRYDVSIISDGDSLGRVDGEEGIWRDGPDGIEEPDPELTEALVIELCAGFSAETKYDPLCTEQAKLGATRDDENARKYLERYLGFSGRELSSKERDLRQRADELVKQHWIGIEALAQDLLRYRHIESTEADMIVDAAEGVENPAVLARYRATFLADRRTRPNDPSVSR